MRSGEHTETHLQDCEFFRVANSLAALCNAGLGDELRAVVIGLGRRADARKQHHKVPEIGSCPGCV
eukprot:4971037-Pyramimonas_sp.AAC.1